MCVYQYEAKMRALQGDKIYLSIIEETQVLVELIEEDVWEAKDKKSGFLIDRVSSWYWLCL